MEIRKKKGQNGKKMWKEVFWAENVFTFKKMVTIPQIVKRLPMKAKTTAGAFFSDIMEPSSRRM